MPRDLVLLLLNLMHTVLDIDRKVFHVHRRDEQPATPIHQYKCTPKNKTEKNIRRISEQVVHLLERAALGLGLESPEVERVGEVADDEEQVEAPADAAHGDGRDLTDHGVEGERHHDADGDALSARAGVEDLGGDDPCCAVR